MRAARRIIHAFLLVLTIIVGTTAAVLIVSQTVWFKNWLREYIVAEAGQYLNGQLSIERLGGSLFFGVELENVSISLDGSEVVAVGNLGVDYNVFDLITKGLSADNISLDRPVIYLRRDGDAWSLAKLVKKQEQEADREGPQVPITIDEIGISGATVIIEAPVGSSGVMVPHRIDQLDAKLAFRYEPVHYSLDISHVSFRGSSPELTLQALSGGVSVKDDTLFVEQLAVRTAETSLLIDGAVQHYVSEPQLNVQVSSDAFSLPELARLVPALAGIDLRPAFEVKLNGPLSALGVDLNVRSSAGQLTGQFVADLQAPGQAVKGDVHVRHLDLAPLLQGPSQRSDLTADLTADVTADSFSALESLRGTASVRSPRVTTSGYTAEQIDARVTLQGRRLLLDARALAYGTRLTAAGPLTLPKGDAPVVFALRGRASGLDIAALPRTLKFPPAHTRLTAAYHAYGSIAKEAATRR
ncbi:MAG: AsmA family protein, partial [Vicinamibacterales bacterium]